MVQNAANVGVGGMKTMIGQTIAVIRIASLAGQKTILTANGPKKTIPLKMLTLFVCIVAIPAIVNVDRYPEPHRTGIE